MKRRSWWKPWKPPVFAHHLEARPFPVVVVLGPQRFHPDDPPSVSMKDVKRVTGAQRASFARLLWEGLTLDQADRVAVELLGTHPALVWPKEWAAAAEADAIVDALLERDRRRTVRFVHSYLSTLNVLETV